MRNKHYLKKKKNMYKTSLCT